MIDPATYKVVDKFKVGLNPQHVVPSYDLRTLWVANNAENTKRGSLTPVDPKTGKPGKAIAVDDPYNMYFSPDGKSAIVVAEAMKRLDFRDPQTMQLQYSIDVPRCAGINHADFSIDGTFAIFTCEFTGTVAKIDLVHRKVLGYTQVIQPGRPTKIVKGPDGKDEVICTTWKGMPQDIRASPDGKIFFVADMMADGVHVVDGETFQADRLHRDRQGNARALSQPRREEALRRQSRLEQDSWRRRTARAAYRSSISRRARSRPTGRFQAAAAPTWATSAPTARRCGFRAATTTSSTRSTRGPARCTIIPVGKEPHGLTVWPQPGRYSLGHTGNLR